MNAHAGSSLRLRQALGTYPTGVTVITTSRGHKNYVGLTANSFTSVSLDPAVILWSLRAASPSYLAFSSAPTFCVNILSERQTDLSRRFATPMEDKFKDVPLVEGLDGVPVLKDVVAHFECKRTGEHIEGDHVIFLGTVHRFDARSELRPLVFLGGRYKTIQEFNEAR